MSKVSEANISRIGEEEALKLVLSVTEEINKSEAVLNPWKRNLVKYNNLYKLIQEKKHYEGLSNLFVPEILRAVETVSSNVYKAITGTNPWFEYVGREKDDEASAEAMSQLVKYQMDENGFNVKLMDSIRQMVISGITVRKVLWDFQQVVRKGKKAEMSTVLDPITKKKSQKRQVSDNTFTETIRDHWTFEGVDLLGFHISDVNTPYNDIQKAKWIAEQYFVDEAWLREKAKKQWITNEYKQVLLQPQSKDSDYRNLSRERNRTDYNEEEKKGFEIIERWGLVRAKLVHSPEDLKQLNLDPEDFVEAVVIIGQRKHLLKLEANPFAHGQKPYLSCPYIPQEFNFAGMSIPQVGGPMQEELNDTRNQTMDNRTLILSCMWLKNRSGGIKNSQLRIRPMGVIDTNDVNALVPLRPPVLTGVGVNLEGVIKEDLRQSVGASSNLQGIAQAGVDTATESSIINKEAFGRLAQVAEMYSQLILKQMFLLVEFLNYQFYDRDKAIKIIGEQGVKFKNIGPDDIVGFKDIVIHLATDSSDNPAVARQQLIQFWTTISQLPPEAIAYHWNMLNQLYKQFFPSGSLEDLYEAPEGKEVLLTPEEENDLTLNGTMVNVKKGDNDDEHLQSHEKDFKTYQYALSEEAYTAKTHHIAQHYAQRDAKVKQQQDALMQQMMAMQPQGGPAGGVNTGQTRNTSASTIANATQPSDLMKMNGAGAP